MGSQDWTVVKVRRDVVERVREELRVCDPDAPAFAATPR